MIESEARRFAKVAYHRAHQQRNASCAVFLNAFGCVFLTRGHGPQYASSLFRYPDGLIGVYDRRVRLGDIVADILAAVPKEAKIAA